MRLFDSSAIYHLTLKNIKSQKTYHSFNRLPICNMICIPTYFIQWFCKYYFCLEIPSLCLMPYAISSGILSKGLQHSTSDLQYVPLTTFPGLWLWSVCDKYIYSSFKFLIGQSMILLRSQDCH